MMFHVLKHVDTDYSRSFGWRQATIWAVEEPENSLHMNLQQDLALTLREWALDDTNRMQIFTTTHSEVFASVADAGFLIELEKGLTRARRRSVSDLVHQMATRGVSGLIHPVLCYPGGPVILIEGDIDQEGTRTRVGID